MRANLDLDGGRIMAEAYMITLAAHLGRDRAHELLYQAVRDSREGGEPLLTTLRSALSADVWDSIAPHLPEPADYLGSTSAICATAVGNWRAGRPAGATVLSTHEGVDQK
jgi:3-carboxy-cis,cis-muconate cycloisomerase